MLQYVQLATASDRLSACQSVMMPPYYARLRLFPCTLFRNGECSQPHRALELGLR